MIRFTTAYQCPGCGHVHTRKDALKAGPLIECAECGDRYARSYRYACYGCERGETRVIAKMACGEGCPSLLRPVRVLRVSGRSRYDGTMQETSDGSLLVRFKAADLKRMAAEADKQGMPRAGDST